MQSISDLWECLISRSVDDDGNEQMAVTPTVPAPMRLTVMELLLAEIRHKCSVAALETTSQHCEAILDQVLIYEASPSSKPVVAKTAHPRMRLTFNGPLSLVPSIGAIKVAEVDGLGIYTRSNIPKSGPLVDMFNVAWLVNCVSYNADTGEPTEEKTA